jgi:hypothetical protein
MLDPDDDLSRDNLRNLSDGTQDLGKGRGFIVYAITYQHYTSSHRADLIIHQFTSTPVG